MMVLVYKPTRKRNVGVGGGGRGGELRCSRFGNILCHSNDTSVTLPLKGTDTKECKRKKLHSTITTELYTHNL